MGKLEEKRLQDAQARLNEAGKEFTGDMKRLKRDAFENISALKHHNKRENIIGTSD